jgi:GTP-binding protein
MKPVIAIVGRPNVGKSTLLNRLVRRKVALVSDTPGVTRDRIFVECTLSGHNVILVDTGGFDPHPDDDMARAAVEQAQMAIEHADFVLFLCDAKDGLHPIDQSIADLLRKNKKDVLCLVNKCDPGAGLREEWEFHRLGLDLLPISASHGTGIEQMADTVTDRLVRPTEEKELQYKFQLKLSLLGRPNVGKSSLANALSGEERQIVSTTPGTTRDAVDIVIRNRETTCLLVDTPGVRRKRSITKQLERMSVVAAIRSLERANVAMVVLDGSEQFADQDARLLRLVQDRGRGLCVVVNKIDLWNRSQREKYRDALAHGMRFVAYAPVIEVSALTAKRVDLILPMAQRVHQSAHKRIATADLNRFVSDSLSRLQPPVVRGKRAKIFYITQAEVNPPTFVAWVNDPTRVPQNYQRYLENRLRKRFPFPGTPLRWIFKSRRTSTKPGGKKR